MMISTWRKRKTERMVAKRGLMEDITSMELVIPRHYTCPISLDLMKDPVTLSTGITYDRENIEKWIEAGNQTCPITNQTLRNIGEPIPNHSIRKMIQQWCVENKDHGIERIPTPRIPVTSSEVVELLAKISKEMHDSEVCKELVSKVKKLVNESERNKRCFVTNGTAHVLSAAFVAFSEEINMKNSSTGEVILSTLTTILPLDGESKSNLGSISSLCCMVWFLNNGSLSCRRNAVFLLKDILKMEEHDKVEILLGIEGALEGLVKLVKEPICPTTTKASLLAIYHMVNSSHSSSFANKKAQSRFADVGLVELLVEMLVDCEKSICEKALGVLDGICSSIEGRKRAYSYALTVPVLVKKLLRVSDLATEFSVSILWKIGKRENGGDVLVEALKLGAFQKLLLLLQVGCSETTKEKASELLKLLNVHRDRAECVDSLDFKSLKRPF
ncbi:PREDICTED: U-box domain-containing protein 21-like [Nicotiana attenuata]|uniref:U-box domain-containing protein n=1 Tax=Nicotiana attenuata TaxID=49451 RepID=A0A1J6JRB8_NICAT|nr:PREDICTED: U-box domain-containing protein 21-like [Nicotiana attenuata]OIT19084.1 u-box domain-containing protein 21 [Nicotiana attenuata]